MDQIPIPDTTAAPVSQRALARPRATLTRSERSLPAYAATMEINTDKATTQGLWVATKSIADIAWVVYRLGTRCSIPKIRVSGERNDSADRRLFRDQAPSGSRPTRTSWHTRQPPADPRRARAV